MGVKIALAGNPNCGKTTLFNALTGANQFVGNWPGVTVEKKEGKLKGYEDIVVTDLPGIYSLSPYTLEEVVARNYLIDEAPEVILNIVDGTNLERNLYLTTQLVELGIPVVIAINMMDVVRKNGDSIDIDGLSKKFGCKVVEISALKEEGVLEAAEVAIKVAENGKMIPHHIFSGPVEHALAHIEEALLHDEPEDKQRWYAIKLFERDEKVREYLKLSEDQIQHIEQDIVSAEEELDDDAEGIIANDRYNYVTAITDVVLHKKNKGGLTTSDKIDRVLTNRWLGLPIFAIIIFLVYYISVTTVGAFASDWANNGLFGEGWHLFGIESVYVPGVPVLVERFLDFLKVAESGAGAVVRGIILDGIVAGVGAVLGFVPQIFVLFILLSFLEACGYMSRVAFVLDRVFRKFGLSGKSFIPILVGTGCGVPGIMASRTIENEKDRRMTIITTTFIPCGAKLPFIALIATAIFNGAWWVAPSAYLLGIVAIICSGIILKKTKLFASNPTPFVMELPAYHMPTAKNLFHTVWERGWSFIKKAGTIILLSTIVVWFLSNFGVSEGSFGLLAEDQLSQSILAKIGGAICWIFIPQGWGTWQAAVATITGLVAKENIVSTLGVLYSLGDGSTYANLADAFAQTGLGVSGYSFLIFNLLCAPCFAAMAAIRREMNSAKWFWIAIGYQTGLAYLVSMVVYQLGVFFAGGGINILTVISFAVIVFFLFMLFRKDNTKGNSIG